MFIFLNLIPYFISFLTGYCLLSILLENIDDYPQLMRLTLGAGLGLGLNAFLTFTSFIFFNRLIPLYVCSLNFSVLIFLIIYALKQKKISRALLKIRLVQRQNKIRQFLGLSFFIILCIPLWMEANFYPYGGWDAWSVWNFKSKFLFLGQNNWQNMFEPVLWRTSPHYPLLLPLINVWGWIFLDKPLYYGPMITSITFTLMTLVLLWSTLKKWLNKAWPAAILPLLLTQTIFLKLAIGQYCDLIIGYYLLATTICLIQAKKDNNHSFALLSGLFTGIQSFTKSEGLVIAGIITLLAPFYINYRNRTEGQKKIIIFFFLGVLIASIIPAIFNFFYAPKNITFINGLFSSAHRSEPIRFKIIFGYYFFEIINKKWGGLWILLAAGVLLGKMRSFNPKLILIPIFLFFYGLIITLYYYTNTYFELTWWLQVTLHRILFALLPIIILWVFSSVGFKDTGQK